MSTPESGIAIVSVTPDLVQVSTARDASTDVDVGFNSLEQALRVLSGEGEQSDCRSMFRTEGGTTFAFPRLDIEVLLGTEPPFRPPDVTFAVDLLVGATLCGDERHRIHIQDGRVGPEAAHAPSPRIVVHGPQLAYAELFALAPHPKRFIEHGGFASGDPAYVALAFALLLEPRRSDDTRRWSEAVMPSALLAHLVHGGTVGGQ